jgi:hypothetical protein
LQIREYQFITLTAGDHLAKLAVKRDSNEPLLNNYYKQVAQDTDDAGKELGTYTGTAVYRLASEETYKSLPGASDSTD